MKNFKISILIVNFNGIKHLKECLESLYSQSYQCHEVVLVDNASIDGSIGYIEKNFNKIKIIKSDLNRGFAGGNNLGIPFCTGDYILFLNNDTRLDNNFLLALNNSINTFSTYSIFACFLLNYNEPQLADSAGDTVYTNGVPHGFSGYPATLFAKPREVTAACAGAALYSKKVLEKIGVFDEDFFLIFEDLDLSFRARHAGEKILFVPDAKVYHKGSASMGGKTSSTSFFYCERNIWLFILKNFPTPIILSMLPNLILFKGFRFFLSLRHRKFKLFLKATFVCMKLIPVILVKRKKILSNSVLTNKEFKQLLRPNWLKERIEIRRGIFKI